MDLKQYSENAAKMLSDSLKAMQELNATKEVKYKSILKAYEERNVILLESTISEVKNVVNEQKVLFSKFEKSFDILYEELVRQIKLVSRDNTLLQRFMGVHAAFKDAVFSSLSVPISDIKMYIDDQLEILEQIKGKDLLKIFFSSKVTLNNLYKSEVEMLYTFNDAYKNLEFDRYKSFLYKKIDYYSKEKMKEKNQNNKRMSEIAKSMSAISFIVFFIDIFRKIHVHDGWLDALYEKIESVEELLPEEDSDSGLTTVLTTTLAIQTILH